MIAVTSPRLDVDDVDVQARSSRSGSRRRLAANAIRVPSGDQAGSPSAVGPSVRRRASPVVGVDEPQVRVAVVDEARAVEHVAEPVDVAVVGRRRLAGLRRGGPAAALRSSASVAPSELETTASRRAVGRPCEGVDAARQVGQPAGLAAVERQQVDLVAVLAVLRAPSGRSGLLLDQQPAVGDEGERPAVGREARMAVVFGRRGSPGAAGAEPSVGTSQSAWR